MSDYVKATEERNCLNCRYGEWDTAHFIRRNRIEFCTSEKVDIYGWWWDYEALEERGIDEADAEVFWPTVCGSYEVALIHYTCPTCGTQYTKPMTAEQHLSHDGSNGWLMCCSHECAVAYSTYMATIIGNSEIIDARFALIWPWLSGISTEELLSWPRLVTVKLVPVGHGKSYYEAMGPRSRYVVTRCTGGWGPTFLQREFETLQRVLHPLGIVLSARWADRKDGGI